MSPAKNHRSFGRGRWAALVLFLVVSAVGGFLALSPGPVCSIQVSRAWNNTGTLEESWQQERDRRPLLRWLLGSRKSWEECTREEIEPLLKFVNGAQGSASGIPSAPGSRQNVTLRIHSEDDQSCWTPKQVETFLLLGYPEWY